jgi:hypothetical protein
MDVCGCVLRGARMIAASARGQRLIVLVSLKLYLCVLYCILLKIIMEVLSTSSPFSSPRLVSKLERRLYMNTKLTLNVIILG